MSEGSPPVPPTPPEAPAAPAQEVASAMIPAPAAGTTFAAPGGAAPAKPGKVQVIAILTLVSGCLNAMWTLYLLFNVLVMGVVTFGIGCLMIPLPILTGTVALMEILYAAKILATPMKTSKPSMAVAILEICCILGCNPLALAAGIVALVLYNDPEVKNYYAAQAGGFPVIR